MEDRGYQFADGVYEVCEVRNGRLVERSAIWPACVARWPNSGSHADEPASPSASIVREVIRRNRIIDGLVYSR